MPLPVCTEKYRDRNQFWENSLTGYPKWLECEFPQTAIIHHPLQTPLEIWDFSASSKTFDYTQYLKNNSNKFNGYTPPELGEKVHQCFSPRYMESIWVARDLNNNKITIHHDTFRLTANANIILQKKPKETRPTPYATRVCMAYPFALLLRYASHINIRRIGCRGGGGTHL